MATGQSAQRGLGGVFGVAELVSWAESGAGRNHLQGGQVPQLLAQLRRAGDDQGFDLIHSLTSGFDGVDLPPEAPGSPRPGRRVASARPRQHRTAQPEQRNNLDEAPDGDIGPVVSPPSAPATRKVTLPQSRRR
jgi:hypothetical protein